MCKTIFAPLGPDPDTGGREGGKQRGRDKRKVSKQAERWRKGEEEIEGTGIEGTKEQANNEMDSGH